VGRATKVTDDEKVKIWIAYHSDPKIELATVADKFKRNKSTVYSVVHEVDSDEDLLNRSMRSTTNTLYKKGRNGNGQILYRKPDQTNIRTIDDLDYQQINSNSKGDQCSDTVITMKDLVNAGLDEVNPRAEDKLLSLENENAYLRWCLTGERNGYVDRLLKELQTNYEHIGS